ncbi:MAG: DNA-3-methyladenine glycosylase [Actinotalea sp.]|nr:DNA-3-methyladenine glycosylase [Actinotalea sp.]
MTPKPAEPGPVGATPEVPTAGRGHVPGRIPPRDWLARPVLEVARDLLGAHVTTSLAEGVVTLRLTEVEAYDGAVDPGSHAFRGQTARNAVMFGPAGHLYVYRHMGLHHCANVVTGTAGAASAVLLRAGEVVEGLHLARSRRLASGVARTDVDLARGPARLAVALGLDLTHYGVDVLDPDGAVVITTGSPAVRAESGPRVGVAGPGGDAVAHPWRFWLPDEPSVSVFRPGAPSRARAARAGAATAGAGTRRARPSSAAGPAD